jgi:hypothetical protein
VSTLCRPFAAGLAALVIASVACDKAPISIPPPTAPTPATQTDPQFAPTVPLAPPFAFFSDRLLRVSGNVFEYTGSGRRSIAGVRVFASGGPGFVQREDITDLGGVFNFLNLPNQRISLMTDPDSRYYTPCPSGRLSLDLDSVIHVHVVSATTLTSGLPKDFPTGGVWGRVYENTPSGREPVVGALVDVDFHREPHWRRATTLSDPEGRFSVCGPVPLGNLPSLLRARKDGYRDAIQDAFVGWDGETGPVDIELVRQ